MIRASRSAALICVAALLLGACASGEDANEPRAASTGTGSDEQTSSPSKKEREGKSESGAKEKDGPGPGKSVDPTSSPDEREGDGGDGSQPDPGPEGGEGNEDDESSAAYPAAGRYTYAQSGWEEFCQTGACERRDLPDRQLVASKVGARSDDGTTVVTEAHSSEGRVTRTTFRFTDRRAFITKVYVRVQYQGFTFENTYSPDPPVESLRFPIEVGARWSGSWQAQTSGDYSVSIAGREQVSVGGRTVNAFRVETSTDFRGELEGHADITVWVDPATKAIVKSVGDMRLKSAFGGYNTSFDITLRDAPRY